MSTAPRRHFDLLAFDWDGTAVADRHADATELRELLTGLLDHGVFLAIITGTNFPNIERQCVGAIEDGRKERLFVLTNRGSEVYGFTPQGNTELRWRRVATPAEEELLTRVADTLRETLVRRTGLEIEVVYDRLNRRKIDLIPLPAWRDPPKSEFAALLAAVETRLRDGGIAGGLQEIVTLAGRIARDLGLEDARITSDIKHVEIGLTDKSDSLRWLVREVVTPNELGTERVLIAGDEFGPIAGVPGSDSRLLIPETRAATFVSVGVEPNGVPPGVIHLRGGPPRFLQLLREQLAATETELAPIPRRPRTAPPTIFGFTPTTDPVWTITVDGFDLPREDELESIFTVANGYLGSRGSIAEGSTLSTPATFIAGVFADTAKPHTTPGLARGPDWMSLRGYLDGREIRLEGSRTTLHRRTLDMRQGLLWREWHHEDDAGKITYIVGVRLASLADRHLLAQFVTLTPVNHDSTLHFVTTIAAGPETGYRASSTHARIGEHPLGIISLEAIGSGVRAAFASAARLATPESIHSPTEVDLSAGALRESWQVPVKAGETYRLDRLVTVFTTRDTDSPEEAARDRLRQIEGQRDGVLKEHVEAWARRWHHAGIDLTGDDDSARALHFAAYHLIGAANPNDERVSVGARALTGNTYQGHVFWDTEIYMLPFYILTHPAAARALLLYRYHTLHRAREKARLYGYRGALFPWESAFDGIEATPPYAIAPDGARVRIHSGEQEHHISAAIAYAAWQYWQLTADNEFLCDAGAELILETARFWASRGDVEADGLYHIRKVVGPDEYHEAVDDNAYTNIMAQWNMERGADVARMMRERWPQEWDRLVERLSLDPHEPEEWQRLARIAYTGLDPETGIFEQFQGYYHLEPIDLDTISPTNVPPDLILGRERIQSSQVIKQADVVLLIFLLWDRFPPAVRAANFEFYEPRCAQGSSLSPAIHALVAARLGKTDIARRYFQQAATIDLADNMGNAAGGVHAGALGALWQTAILGYAGFHPRADRFTLEPRLPPEWRSLSFRLQWRGRTILTTLSGTHPEPAPPGEAAYIELLLETGDPVPAELIPGAETTLTPGEPQSSIRTRDGWGPWRLA